MKTNKASHEWRQNWLVRFCNRHHEIKQDSSCSQNTWFQMLPKTTFQIEERHVCIRFALYIWRSMSGTSCSGTSMVADLDNPSTCAKIQDRTSTILTWWNGLMHDHFASRKKKWNFALHPVLSIGLLIGRTWKYRLAPSVTGIRMCCVRTIARSHGESKKPLVKAISNSFFILGFRMELYNGRRHMWIWTLAYCCQFRKWQVSAWNNEMGRLNRELVRLINKMQAAPWAWLCRIIFPKSAAPQPPTTKLRRHFPGVEPSHARMVSFGPLAAPTTWTAWKDFGRLETKDWRWGPGQQNKALEVASSRFVTHY